MEWELDKYNNNGQRSARNEQSERPVRADSGASRSQAYRERGDGLPETRARVPKNLQKKRRMPLPPWILVLGSLLFYCFFFHVWTENHFSVGRFLTLIVSSKELLFSITAILKILYLQGLNLIFLVRRLYILFDKYLFALFLSIS